MKLKAIHEQVVVVVGATSGIGLETARLLARRGAKLVLTGREHSAVESAAREVRSLGAEVTTAVADVAVWEDVKGIAQAALEAYGRIDTWVHVPSVSIYAEFLDIAPEEFKRIIDVNLTGAAYGAMAALPFLKIAGQGSLILLGSVESRVALPYHSAYAASKHGINGLTKAIRLELRKQRIPVNLAVVMPSSINTPFFEKSRTKLGVEPKPMPPVYDPVLVARAIAYAAEHPVREITVGDSGLMFQFMQRMSPRLTDSVIYAIGFRMQKSSEPKSEDAPDNLYTHLPGYNNARGTVPRQSMKVSPGTWLQINPVARWLMSGAMLGAAAALTLKWTKGRD